MPNSFSLAELRLRVGPQRHLRFGSARHRFRREDDVRFADGRIDIETQPSSPSQKKPDDFRDRKLTDLTTAQVARAVLKSPAGEIELAKKNEHWEIVKPLQARGNDQKIGDLLAQVTNARIQEFVTDEKGDLHAYGLSEPRGSITVYGADDKEGRTLQLGQAAEKIKDAVYVRYLPRNAIYALPKKTDEVLTVRPNDLRDRHLVRLDTNNLDRLNIGSGQPKIVLARKDQSGVAAGATAGECGEVRRMNTLKIKKCQRCADTASDLPKYGPINPSKIELALRLGNTDDNGAGNTFPQTLVGRSRHELRAVGEEPSLLRSTRTANRTNLVDPLRSDLPIFSFNLTTYIAFSRMTTEECSSGTDRRIGNGSMAAVLVGQTICNRASTLAPCGP